MDNLFFTISCLSIISPSLLAVEISENLNDLAQDDPQLVNYIKDNLLKPPPLYPEHVSEMNLTAGIDPEGIVYAETNKGALQGQYGQPLIIEELFKPLGDQKKFFIEAGAYDGVTGSNTLRLELDPSWTGLLVEPHPDSYQATVGRHRNAWTINCCFSTKTHPEVIDFDIADILSGIINYDSERKPGGGTLDGKRVATSSTMKMQCMPLYSVLLALGNFKIVSNLSKKYADYYSFIYRKSESGLFQHRH